MDVNYGFRVFQKVERPKRSIVELFDGIPTSNINDNMNRLFCMKHEIKPYNHHQLLGTAITVKSPIGDNAVIHKALDIAQPGDVLVIDGAGALDRALIGEIMVAYAEGKGLSGFVIDGAVRDVAGLKHSSIPVYAAGATPQGPYKNGPGEINVPISCGGQVVFPGDILVGDQDGIVVIRPEIAEALAKVSRKKLEIEDEKLARIRNGDIEEAKHKERYDKILVNNHVQIMD